jgi:hypothetical protein
MASVKKQNKASFTEAKKLQKLFFPFFIYLQAMKDPQKKAALKKCRAESYQIKADFCNIIILYCQHKAITPL